MTDFIPVLVVQMGQPPPDIRSLLGEQGDWFVTALASTTSAVTVVKPANNEILPEPGRFAAIVLTGSWAMVTERRDWSERTAAWIRHVVSAEVPLLGVCYGHQLMAHALGGRVGDLPGGAETGRLDVNLLPEASTDPLFATAPARFSTYLTHRQSVLEPPSNARILGVSQRDRHQILRYSDSALSVQFHPEFKQSLMRACITRSRANRSPAETRQLLADLGEAPVPRQLLHRFIETAAQPSPSVEHVDNSHSAKSRQLGMIQR